MCGAAHSLTTPAFAYFNIFGCRTRMLDVLSLRPGVHVEQMECDCDLSVLCAQSRRCYLPLTMSMTCATVSQKTPISVHVQQSIDMGMHVV